MRAVEPSWDDLLNLHVVRRLGQIVERRFGHAPGYAKADGEWVAGPVGSEPLARRASDRARGGGPGRTTWDGRIEIFAPILVGERYAGCVFGSGLADADLGLLEELIGLCAEEIALFQVESALRDRRGEASPGPSRYDFANIIGRSRPVQELYRLLDKVIESDSTVLIAGENGTGKELVARAIHFNSARADERFVVQNCSAFNDNLLDSELFGHKKGSFTGAFADKRGLFEVADRGTFFLDEIGDMSAALQVKLLRVLQEGTFTPVGDTGSRQVDVRILAATNKDLRRLVERGEFREDLFYRVNVLNVTCPPLRERSSDIPLLVDHFLRKRSRGRRLKQKRLTKGCLDRMIGYSWPGNIRELENEVERLVVLAGDEKVIGEELLSPRVREQMAEGGPSAQPSSLGATVEAIERQTIHAALEKHGWNKTRAARELDVSRRNLLRKVERYDLDPSRRR